MTNTFRKDAFILLLISALLTALSSVFLFIDAFYPFNGAIVFKSYIYLAAYLFSFSILESVLAFNMGKYKASLLCKIIGVYTFITFPVLLLLAIFFGLFVPKENSSLYYYLTFVSLGVIIAYQIFKTIYFSNRLMKENKGYVVFKTISILIIAVAFSLLLFLISGYIKIIFYDGTATDPTKMLLPGYYVSSVIMVVILFGLALYILYVGYSCFLSGVVNDLVDLRHNYKFTVTIFIKYHVVFYIGVIANIVMFVAALIATIGFLKHYFSLMALYLSLLLITIPVHYYDLYIEKKYQGDYQTIFKKKHIPLIYTGIIFVAYGVITIIFGSASQGKSLDDNSMLSILLLFVPYALIRMGIAIAKYLKYRKLANPPLLANFHVNVLMAIFTFTNVIIMLGMTLSNWGLLITAMYLFIVLTAYCLIVALFLIVVGICGLTNRRREQFKIYLEANKTPQEEKIIDILDEE